MLTRADLEYQSIFYYLKEGLLSREFSQEVQNEPLCLDPKLYNGSPRTDYLIIDPDNSVFGKIAAEKGRGWVSFELDSINPAYVYNETEGEYVPTYNTPFFNKSFSLPINREQNYITIRDQNNNIVPRDWYQLDYQSCRVRYPCPTTPSGAISSGIMPTTIDYRFHLVSILDGWPTQEEIPTAPFICLYPTKELIAGYQIGPGVEFRRSYIIDIFGNSTSNRRQLVDFIKQAIFNKHTPVLDFNRSGYPLKHWGVINEDFIQTISYNGNNYSTYLTLNPGNGQILYFLNIEVSYDTSPRGTMANAVRHRAQIKFETSSFSDKDPELVGKFSGLKEPLGGYDSLIRKSYTA